MNSFFLKTSPLRRRPISRPKAIKLKEKVIQEGRNRTKNVLGKIGVKWCWKFLKRDPRSRGSTTSSQQGVKGQPKQWLTKLMLRWSPKCYFWGDPWRKTFGIWPFDPWDQHHQESNLKSLDHQRKKDGTKKTIFLFITFINLSKL